jgi:hypothetical protein
MIQRLDGVILTELCHRVAPGEVCFEDIMHDATPSNNRDDWENLSKPGVFETDGVRTCLRILPLHRWYSLKATAAIT